MRILHEQQIIKFTVTQTSKEARISAFEAQLGVNSQPKEGDIAKKRERLLKNQHGGETVGIL